MVRYVEEHRWHESQKLTRSKDGSLLTEFDLDGTEEIKRWILSFGQHTEVREPERMREDLRGELLKLEVVYAASEKR